MKKFAIVWSLIGGVISGGAFAGSKTAGHAGHHEGVAAEVTLDEMKKIVEAKSAMIFDCNGAEMYAKGHIPGALSFAEHEGKLAAVLPKDKNALIVAYCGGTMCSSWEGAAKEAKEKGYTNIKHYSGGIKGWTDAKMAVETGPGKAS